MLKYAAKFKFNSEEYRELIGNDMKGKSNCA